MEQQIRDDPGRYCSARTHRESQVKSVLKKVLLVILGVVTVLLVAGFILPADYAVSRTAFITASADEIHEVVADLRSWSRWTVWNDQLDPTLEVEYSIGASPVGSSFTWTGDALGVGSLEIISAEEGRGIVYLLAFEGGSPAEGVIQITQMKGGSEVLWKFSGIADPPLGPYMIGWIESMIDSDFETGLKNLQEELK